MTPEQAEAEAASGELRPVYLVVGEERLLVDRVLFALRDAAGKGGVAGFNEDKYTAGEVSVDAVIAAAKMVPMMAKRRTVLLRGLDRWEKKDDEDDAPKGKGVRTSPLDELAEYAKAPVPSTVMILVATKLHGQRRLMSAAKKNGFLVACDPLPRAALPGWIERAARSRGHSISMDVAEQLAEIAGPELGYVDDAIERLSLYVGPKAPITEDAVVACVTRVRQSSVWDLLDAIVRRRVGPSLAMLADVFDPRDGGLRLLGSIAWSVRQLVKMESALKAGANVNEAAARAGVPPFKAQNVADVVKRMPPGTTARWMRLLAETDLALKGSRRPAQAVLETMILEMSGGALAPRPGERHA